MSYGGYKMTVGGVSIWRVLLLKTNTGWVVRLTEYCFTIGKTVRAIAYPVWIFKTKLLACNNHQASQ